MIKRWSTGVGDTVAQRPEGEYVLFTDHESARKEWEAKEKEYAAREKRLREALARLYSANRGASSVETLITALEHAKTILDEGDS